MPRALDASLATSADDRPRRFLTQIIYKTGVIAELEVRQLKHDPTELVTRAVQPALCC
jgi:ABC-2 type transport system permease protein